MTIEIQDTSAVAASDATKNGVAHFDSARFTVDTAGFVSTNGTGIIKWNVITQLTQPTNAAVNNGYICNAGGTNVVSMALPVASAVGDIIEVVLNSANSWQISQAAGQQIRVGNVQTTAGAGGSLMSNRAGDFVRLVCDVANLHWIAVGYTGNITVT